MQDIQSELRINLQDQEWPFEYTDHDREIVRAIVFDDAGYYYFVRARRNVCKVFSFGDKMLTRDEIESFHLST